MGKISRLVACGLSGVGKTSILEHLIYGNNIDNDNNEPYKTIEDTYLAQVDTDRGVKETIKVVDTCGDDWSDPQSYPKHYFNFGDGFILVYSITSKESFACVESIKKELEKCRKDAFVVVVGNKSDQQEHRQVDASAVSSYVSKEKVKHFEVSKCNKKLLAEPFVYITSKMTQPPAKSTILGRGRIKTQNTLD